MWQEYFEGGHLSGVVFFSEFLRGSCEIILTDRHVTWDSEPYTLFDAIWLWLEHGNGFDVCPTYESYLLTVIAIIEAWSHGDHIEVLDAPIWPWRREGSHVGVKLFERRSFAEGGLEQDLEFHPMLRREIWDKLHTRRTIQIGEEELQLLLSASGKRRPRLSQNR